MKPVEIEILMKGNLSRGLDDTRRKAESLESVLKRVGATVGIAFGTREAIEFAKKIMDVRGEVESLQVSFETLAGTTNGRKLFGDILEFAVSTPMMMQDLAKGAQTLLGFNVEAEKVMPILRQIGDISMGDAQKFNSLTLAFAQNQLLAVLGVGGLPFKKVDIDSTDPLANVIELGSAQSGILVFGIGGGSNLYPGVYSISRTGHVNTILEAKSVTSVTSTGSEITVTKALQNRATALWIKVQS